MQKITFDEWKNSMSFMLDDAFDRHFLGSIKPLTQFINLSASNFNNHEKLHRFLTKSEDVFSPLVKLKALVSLIGLSEERLKRVVSLMRFKFRREEFRTEWNINRISKTIRTDKEFANLLIDFFINGRNSTVGQEIPLYYMRNFDLKKDDFLQDLSEFNYVDRILNDNEIQGRYSNEVGAHVEKIIAKTLDDYGKSKNIILRYDEQKEFPLLNKNLDFLIPNVQQPVILIESSYNTTTGSGQSKRADQLVELYGILMKHNANHRKNKIMMLNYCDGFGWVGRQNDLHRIYDASDFVFNRNNLSVLTDALDEFYI